MKHLKSVSKSMPTRASELSLDKIIAEIKALLEGLT
jgi:hypothetical protein